MTSTLQSVSSNQRLTKPCRYNALRLVIQCIPARVQDIRHAPVILVTHTSAHCLYHRGDSLHLVEAVDLLHLYLDYRVILRQPRHLGHDDEATGIIRQVDALNGVITDQYPYRCCLEFLKASLSTDNHQILIYRVVSNEVTQALADTVD